MKYLDEYRDPDLAAAAAGADRTRRPPGPGRSWRSAAGRRTRSSGTASTSCCPPEIELVHGPGCPVCVTPLEMIDKALAIAARPGVIFCSFGDMLRVPGSARTCSAVKSRGRRRAGRLLAARRRAAGRAEPRPRRWCSSAIGFETTAPANAMAVYQARAAGLTNFSLLVSHVLVPPAMAAILESPGNRVQGFLAAGHVCTVMGYARVRAAGRALPRADRRHRLRAARHARGHPLRRAAAGGGPAEVENAVRARRAGRGQPARRRRCSQDVFEVRDRKWRGIGDDPAERLAAAPTTYRDFDAERRFDVGDDPRPRSRPMCVSGEVLQGLKKPHECPAFGTRVHAAATRSARRWCPPRARAPPTTATGRLRAACGTRSCAEATGSTCDRGLGLPGAAARLADTSCWATAAAARLIGRADRAPVPAGVRQRRARRRARRLRACVEVGGARLAFTTDSFVVRPLFFPGGDIGELAVNGTVNDLAMCGARAAVAVGRLHPRGGTRAGRRSARVVDGDAARPRGAAGVQLVTGDTKVVDAGHGDGMFINTAGIGLRAGRRRHRARPAPAPATSCSSAATSATTASRSWRARGAGVRDDGRERHRAAARAGGGDAGDRRRRARPARPDPRRPGRVAERDRQGGEGRGRAGRARPADPGRRSRDACELLGLDPLYVANEGKLVAFVAPAGRRARCWPRCAPIRWARRPR